MPIRNPFLYGKPVPPKRFVGRRGDVRTLYSRLYNGESTAIVGEPHIGKSSLLKYLTAADNWSGGLGEQAESSRHFFIDSHLIATSEEPADFWRRIAEKLQELFPEPWLEAPLTRVRLEPSSFHLSELFLTLGRNDCRLVLLLDEFDVLVHHPNFQTADFFGTLRSLTAHTDGLALVAASRQSVSELNRRTSSVGSPFFNTLTEVNLRAFAEEEVTKLLEATLDGTGVTFTEEDRAFLDRLAGCHPYLVQATAAVLFDAVIDGKSGEKRYAAPLRELPGRVAAYFDDLWQYATPAAQTALVILALAEVDGQLHRRDFDTSELGELDRFKPELERLEGLGLVERVGERGWHGDWGNLVLWHGHRWRIAVASFSGWIADHAIASTRTVLDFDEWLRQREIDGLLTRGEKESLKALADKVPKSVVTGAGELLGTFLKGLLKPGSAG